MPARLQPKEDIGSARLLATSLLHCGVLRQDDWNGNLNASLDAGITRWVQERRASADRQLHLNLFYTDDARSSGIVNDWMVDTKEDRPTGCFALAHDPYGPLEHVCIGNIVLDLETLYAGAGWSLWRALQWGLDKTTGALTPRTAIHAIDRRFDIFRDDPGLLEPELDNPTVDDYSSGVLKAYESGNLELLDECIGGITGLLTPADVKRKMPKQFYSDAKPSRSTLVRALESLEKYERENREGRALELGVQLLDAIKRTNRRFKDSPPRVLFLDAQGPISIVVRWHPDDVMMRIVDDEIEDMNQRHDYITEICWFAGFHTDDAASVGHAAERLHHAMEIATLCDQLLDLMHSEQPLRSEPKPGRNLIKVLY